MVANYNCPSCDNSLNQYSEFSPWYDCNLCDLEIVIRLNSVAIFIKNENLPSISETNFRECSRKFKLKALL